MHCLVAVALLHPCVVAASFFDAVFDGSEFITGTTPAATAVPTRGDAMIADAKLPNSSLAAFRAQAPLVPVLGPFIGRTFDPDASNRDFNPNHIALQEREIVTAEAQGAEKTGNVGPTQYPTVTTYWPEVKLPNGDHTWIPVTYTQTFAAVPDQWPSPGVGTVGYGDEDKKATEKAIVAKSQGESAGDRASVSPLTAGLGVGIVLVSQWMAL